MTNKSWVNYSIILGLFLVVASFALFITQEPPSPSYAAIDEQSLKQITVQGTGTVSASPDWSIIRIGAEKEAKSVEEAQSLVAEIMSAVQNALIKQGVKEEHIRTVDYSVHPNYRYDNEGGRQLIGYVVRHILNVEYGAIDKIGPLIDHATKAGANRVDQIQFTIKEDQALEKEALEKAVTHARNKAETLAQAEGKRIVSVHQIIESGASTGVPYMPMMALESADSAKTSIAPGQIDKSKTIEVTYIIE